MHPLPTAPEYDAFMSALSARFAAAFVRGGTFTVGALGDSTLAGADNCYFDNWLSTLERQLKPLFKVSTIKTKTKQKQNSSVNLAAHHFCVHVRLPRL